MAQTPPISSNMRFLIIHGIVYNELISKGCHQAAFFYTILYFFN